MTYSSKRAPLLRGFSPLRSSAVSLGLSAVLFSAGALVGTNAHAGDRDDIRAAYDASVNDFNELEFDTARDKIVAAIAIAEKANENNDTPDPTLAALYVVQAALYYSTEGDEAEKKISGSLKKAVALNYYVVIPAEMRSEGMSNYLEGARSSVGSPPSDAITHQAPTGACGEELHFEALLNVPDGGQAALYWRKVGESEFVSVPMPVFSNVAEITLAAEQHADSDIEYFIFAFDASNQPAANKGTQESPLAFSLECVEAVVAPVPVVEEELVEEVEEESQSTLPKVWINLGFGTGFGIAHGTAENTWSQFDPAQSGTDYGAAHAGCALARWYAGGKDPSSLSAGERSAIFNQFGPPGQADALSAAWNGDVCDSKQSISSGMATAPFHIEPELSFRIGKKKNMSLGVYGRLQIVTGSHLIDVDPNKAAQESFDEDVRSENPTGVETKVDFTWAMGVKFKYFLGKETSKFRPFVGAFGGFGHSRLRVDLGFGNDVNGNSVPDDREVAYDIDSDGNCYPVWPYNDGCSEDSSDVQLAEAVRQNASGENRVDTVAIGPVFVGGIFGFNYQLSKHFALFGEVQVGGWFPKTGSLLFDLNVGPALTF